MRATSPRSRAFPPTASGSSTATSATRPRRPALRRARRGGALRGREPQRQLAREPPPVPRDEHRRHVHAARGGAEARHPLPPHLDRRGLRRPRARRPGEVHRADAVQPVQPVLVDEGGQRPARPRLGALVRREGDDLELLEQLRPVPARREVHPPPDHERPARRAPQALRQGRERARLDPRQRPLLRRADDPRAAASSARPTSSAPTARRTTRRSSSSSSRPSASPPTRTTTSSTGPATTSGTRSTRPGCAPSSAGQPKFSDFEAGIADTIDWYREHEAWWAPQKDATEARYTAQGQ